MVLQLTSQSAFFSNDQWSTILDTVIGQMCINFAHLLTNVNHVSNTIGYQPSKDQPFAVLPVGNDDFVVAPGDTGTLPSSLCMVTMGSPKLSDVFHGNPWWPKSMVITNQLRHETHWLRSAIHIICPLDCTLASAAPANKGCAFDSSGS